MTKRIFTHAFYVHDNWLYFIELIWAIAFIGNFRNIFRIYSHMLLSYVNKTKMTVNVTIRQFNEIAETLGHCKKKYCSALLHTLIENIFVYVVVIIVRKQTHFSGDFVNMSRMH